LSQSDYNLANQSGPSFRSELNSILASSQTQNSGSSAPTTTFAGQFWIDTANSLLKQRNQANSAWNIIGVIDKDGWMPTYAGNPNGVVTGNFAGQHLYDTTNGLVYVYTGSSTVWKRLINSIDLPVGSLMMWAGQTAPTNWAIRNGAAISRTTYADLFKLLVTDQAFSGQTFTVTIASPGVVTKTAHGFLGGERLRFSTTGALPTGLNTSTDCFVETINANTFYLCSDQFLQTRINTSGSQSGTHTYTQSLFGLGDGSTTFNLPDDRDLFERGYGTSRAVGTAQYDAFRAHTHGVTINANAGGGSVPAQSSSGSSAVAGTNSAGGTETRPQNRAYLPIIKVL
jgi:microcystin-dependent protein